MPDITLVQALRRLRAADYHFDSDYRLIPGPSVDVLRLANGFGDDDLLLLPKDTAFDLHDPSTMLALRSLLGVFSDYPVFGYLEPTAEGVRAMTPVGLRDAPLRRFEAVRRTACEAQAAVAVAALIGLACELPEEPEAQA